MARIEILAEGAEIVYRLVGRGNTGEVFDDLPAAGIPETVAHNLGLLPTRYGPTGEAEAYTRYVLGKDEERVSIPQEVCQEPAPLRLKMKDGTDRPAGFNWKLDVLPVAVKECHLELRQGFIEQKEPATTKAAYRADEHRRATLIVERAEQGKRGAFPRVASAVRRI